MSAGLFWPFMSLECSTARMYSPGRLLSSWRIGQALGRILCLSLFIPCFLYVRFILAHWSLLLQETHSYDLHSPWSLCWCCTSGLPGCVQWDPSVCRDSVCEVCLQGQRCGLVVSFSNCSFYFSLIFLSLCFPRVSFAGFPYGCDYGPV